MTGGVQGGSRDIATRARAWLPGLSPTPAARRENVPHTKQPPPLCLTVVLAHTHGINTRQRGGGERVHGKVDPVDGVGRCARGRLRLGPGPPGLRPRPRHRPHGTRTSHTRSHPFQRAWQWFWHVRTTPACGAVADNESMAMPIRCAGLSVRVQGSDTNSGPAHRYGTPTPAARRENWNWKVTGFHPLICPHYLPP